jgi:1,2-diacylglycerol 3-beta-glucosyltransferase
MNYLSIGTILNILLFLAICSLAFIVGYLLLLTGAAWWVNRKPRPAAGPGSHRFLVLIPAHNEERLLPALLDSLANQDYPNGLWQVHVVADNCSDQTAEVAAQKGARVHTRVDSDSRGKGFALQWLLERLWQAGIPHDAVVILDADSIVSPDFLRALSAELTRGARVVQAYYAVREAGRSWNESLRYAAFAVLHYLRPLGRMSFGGSAGLKGNGMAFEASVLKGKRWSGALTEDIEMHIALLLEGERVAFAPQAVVWGEMPASFASMRSQHNRWEHGRLEMTVRRLPALVRAAAGAMKAGQIRSAVQTMDAALEYLIPPFSLLAGLSGISLFAALILYFIQPSGQPPLLAQFNLALAVGVLIGQAIYLFSGLRLVGAPGYVYGRLLYAPLLVAWKIFQLIKVILTRNHSGWVRTARNEG